MNEGALETSGGPALFGSEGQLILVRIEVEAKSLEDLLDTLTQLEFPINPELSHHPGCVKVEFPAYLARVSQIRSALRARSFDDSKVELTSVLAAHA